MSSLTAEAMRVFKRKVLPGFMQPFYFNPQNPNIDAARDILALSNWQLTLKLRATEKARGDRQTKTSAYYLHAGADFIRREQQRRATQPEPQH